MLDLPTNYVLNVKKSKKIWFYKIIKCNQWLCLKNQSMWDLEILILEFICFRINFFTLNFAINIYTGLLPCSCFINHNGKHYNKNKFKLQVQPPRIILEILLSLLDSKCFFVIFDLVKDLIKIIPKMKFHIWRKAYVTSS